MATDAPMKGGLRLLENTVPRMCSNCVHALFGPGGVYCRLFHEDVEDTVAEDCDAYELDEMAHT